MFATNVSAQENEKLTLTLDQAIELALSESPSVKIADITVKKTGYAKQGTYASLYPQINLSGSFQQTIKKQVMSMMGQEFEVGQEYNASAGASASMSLINAQLWKTCKLSAMDVEIAVEQARSSRIGMVKQVSQTFYSVLFAKEAFDLYKETYDNQKRNFENVEKKYNAGKASEFEFLRAQVNMKNAEPDVYSGETAVNLALWQLKAVMGIDFNTDIDVVGSIKDYSDKMLIVEENISQEMLKNNSTLIQLDLQAQSLEQRRKQVAFGYIPTLTASFAYNYMAMGSTFDMTWNPYCFFSLNLNIPIFDGFSKRSQSRTIRASQDILKLQTDDTQRQLLIAAKNYTNYMQTALKRYAAAQSTLDMAQKSYSIAEKMFEVGKATIIELNDAELALMQAKLNISQSIYQFLDAQASLNEIIGQSEELNK